ncbi:MAG: transglycosylase domain-containing protein [Lachnospiraceae bacterium]|nr:transglycosylase domain-containing protein [Lachnospiraceae bacterium]
MSEKVFVESDLDEEDKRPRKVKKRKKHRLFWFIVKLQIFLMILVVGAVAYYYLGGYAAEVKALKEEAVAIVAASDEKTFMPGQTSAVYDVNGELISERNGEKVAEYVRYEDIPAKFIVAIISIEDKKFYSHNGVDFRAVFRAAKAMFENGKVTQGGSTITMQLGKLMFMEHGQSWQYKVQQMFIATELEKKYTKSQILEFYLNNIYFANGYYGIEAACHGYFDCELNELDMSQIAFLLSIPNSPSYYDPLVNYSNTMSRRNLILDNIYADGKMGEEEYLYAKREDVVLNLPQKGSTLWNNYVDTYVYHCATKAMMEKEGFEFRYYFDSEEQKQEYNEEYDELYAACQKKLYTGGYKIYTSIDMEKQKWLQSAVDNELAYFMEQNEEGVYAMQGAATCIDNETGYVVAIVGGRSQNFSGYTLNRAYQSHRQPGSAIKPLIVYTPCFERGYTPDSIVDDHELEDGPANSGGSYAGQVTIRTAVAKSLNTVAWQLYEELTPEVGLEYLKNMNFSAIVDEDYVLPTALGGFTNGVSTVEMAAAYATIENDGVYRNPTCILSIVDSYENTVYVSEQLSCVVYKETAARMMTDVLTSVMTEGTGRKLALENMPCAGKTGTTNDHKDGWFVGFTRYYTTSVWVGYDMPREVENLMGNTYPEQIWQRYMEMVHQDLTPLDFLPYAKLSEEFVEEQENLEQEMQERRNGGSNSEETPDENPAAENEQGDPASPEEQVGIE